VKPACCLIVCARFHHEFLLCLMSLSIDAYSTRVEAAHSQ
jgi:hypothetical protein